MTKPSTMPSTVSHIAARATSKPSATVRASIHHATVGHTNKSTMNTTMPMNAGMASSDSMSKYDTAAPPSMAMSMGISVPLLLVCLWDLVLRSRM